MIGIIFAVCSYFSYMGNSIDRMKYSRKRLKEAKENGKYSYIDWYGDERSVLTGMKIPTNKSVSSNKQLIANEYYANNIDDIISTLECRENKINEIKNGVCLNPNYVYRGFALMTKWDKQTQTYKDIPLYDTLFSLDRNDNKKDFNAQKIIYHINKKGKYNVLDMYEYCNWMCIPVNWKMIFDTIDKEV